MSPPAGWLLLFIQCVSGFVQELGFSVHSLRSRLQGDVASRRLAAPLSSSAFEVLFRSWGLVFEFMV